MNNSFKFFKLMFTLLSVFISINIKAQMVGGGNPNQSAPKEVKATELNKGAYTSDVNLFTGTMATGYDLGDVTTPSGLRFNVHLSHSSTKTVGNSPMVTAGIPYGDGWNLDLPTISISSSAYEKFTDADIATSLNPNWYINGDNASFSRKEFAKEGDLAWYSPVISIPGVINERFILKTFDKRTGEAVFVPHRMEKYVEARFKFGSYWKVTNDNGDIYTFYIYKNSFRAPQNLNFVADSMNTPTTYINHTDSISFDTLKTNKQIVDSLTLGDPDVRVLIISKTKSKISNHFIVVYAFVVGTNIMKENLLPKNDIDTWYCNTITNKNSPLNQQIVFRYSGFGDFDFFTEHQQKYLNERLAFDFGVTSLGTIPAFKFQRDILLESVASYYYDRGMIEEIELIHHTVLPPAGVGTNMLLISDKSVTRIDSMYNSRIVYSQGVNTIQDSLLLRSNAYRAIPNGVSFMFGNQINSNFNNWRRYLHVMSDDPIAVAGRPVIQAGSIHHNAFANSSNPYLFSGGWSSGGGGSSLPLRPANGIDFYKYNSHVSSTSANNGDISFNHGFLESPRIKYDIVAGDIYEVRSVIKNLNTSGAGQVKACNFDVNIVSGITLPFGSGSPNYTNNELGDTLTKSLDETDYQRGTRGVSVFSTFANPLKWTSYANTNGQTGAGYPANMVGVTNTSNFFLMPTIPDSYQGVNIQIGASNADIDYSLDQRQYLAHGMPYSTSPTSLYRRSAYWGYKKVQIDNPNGQRYFSENTFNPHNKPSHNFGIGMPWYMLNETYTNLSGSPFSNQLNSNYLFWWKDLNDPIQDVNVQAYSNQPTMADANVNLSAMELVRYSKNPYMLVAVKKYKYNGRQANDSILKYKFLVSHLKLKYDVKTDSLFLNSYATTYVPFTKDTVVDCVTYHFVAGSQNNVYTKKIFSKRDFVGLQNVYLLQSIKQIPVNGSLGNAPFTYVEANMPTTTFGYKRLTSDSLVIVAKQYDFTGSMYCISKITDQLGGVMEYDYYPLHDLKNTHYASIYHDFSYRGETPQNPYNRPNTEVYKLQIVVKAKRYFNSASATLPTKTWLYSYSDNLPAGTCYRGNAHFVYEVAGSLSGLANYRFPNVQVEFGFKQTTVTYPQLVTPAVASPYDVYTHFTTENRVLTFGKLKSVQKFDASNQLLTKKEYTYKQSMAYGNMMLSHHDQFIISEHRNWTYPEYYYAPNYAINYTTAQQKAFGNSISYDLEVNTEYDNMTFLEALANNDISNFNQKNQLNCYFVRLVKETNTDYDFSNPTSGLIPLLTSPVFVGTSVTDIALTSGIGQSGSVMRISGKSNPEPLSAINSLKLGYSTIELKKSIGAVTTVPPNLFATELTSITEYDYWDADSIGRTTSDGYRYLMNTVLTDTNVKTNVIQLHFEPSWELFRTTTYSPHLAGTYHKTENYFYYDVKQNYRQDQPTLVQAAHPEKFDALNYSHLYGIRNLPYQKREVAKAVSHPEVSKSLYYWYDTKTKTDTVIFVDTVLISGTNNCYVAPVDTTPQFDPFAGTDFSDCIPIPHPYSPPPAGYHLTQTGTNSYMYCPNTVPDAQRPLVYPNDLKTKLLLRSINEQVDTIRTATNQGFYYPVMRFKELTVPIGGGFYTQDYAWLPNYITKNTYQTYEHTINGLVREDANERNLHTRYDYHTMKYSVLLDVLHPCNNSSGFDLSNQGVPECITVGYGLSNALKTCYRYNKDFTIDSIIDPNNLVLSYKYDYFSRMRMARRNSDTLSLTAYSQWLNDTTLSFENRAEQNYVESLVLLNKGSKEAERSRAYIDPLGRKYDVQTQVTANYTIPTLYDTLMIHSGLTIYDNWDRVVKQYKPFKFVNAGGAPVNFAPRFNPTALYTEQQYEPNQRGHVLRASKFGESISTGHTVNSSYQILTGYQFKLEIGLSNINLAQVAGTFLNTPLHAQRYLKTASVDEDGKKVVSYTNALGQKVATKTYANGAVFEVTAFIYDSQGNLKKVINPKLQATTYEYNLSGNLFRKVSVDADTVKYMYDISGNVVLERDANGTFGYDDVLNKPYLRKYSYDIFNRIVKQERDYYLNNFDPLQYVQTPRPSDTTKAFYIFSYASTLDFTSGWLTFTCGPHFPIDLFRTTPITVIGVGPPYDPTPTGGNCQTTFYNPYDSLTFVANEKAWQYHTPANTDVAVATTFAQTNLKGRVSLVKSWSHDGTFSNLNAYTYNNDGLLLKELVQFNKPSGGSIISSYINYPNYNLRNSLLKQEVDVNADGTPEMTYSYVYDGWNRLKTFNIKQGASGATNPLASYTYNDALGLVTKTTYYNPNMACTPVIDVTTYNYDNRNRLTQINSQLYNEKLYYDGNMTVTANPAFNVNGSYNYNGNINGLTHNYKFNIPQVLNYAATAHIMDSATVYGYRYDGINRLTSADASVLNALIGTPTIYTPRLAYGDEQLTYDNIGNIQTLKRGLYYPPTTTTPANVFQNWRYVNVLNKNQLGYIDSASTVHLRDYTYDKNGNQRTQLINGKTVTTQYMRSNLVRNQAMTGIGEFSFNYEYNNHDDRIYKTTTFGTGIKTYYLRDASGKEMASLDVNTSTWTHYAHGRERVAEFVGTNVSYYNYDHLGSVRVMYKTNNACGDLGNMQYTILSANDYMAFGKTLRSFNNTNKYAYQGSEKEKEISDNDYYTHYRELNTEIARWSQVDPKDDEQLNYSPYVSMNNNPIIYTDIDGDIVEYERFRDKVNSFFSRVFNKEYRDNFKIWNSSADIYTITKNINGRGSLANAKVCEGVCENGIQHNTIDYSKGFTTNDISNVGIRIAVIPFDIAFNVVKFPLALSTGIGISVWNLFSKNNVGWGWGNRINLTTHGGNLLSWGFGNYNKYNMFGQSLSGSFAGSARINPEGLYGRRLGVGKKYPINFIDIGPEIINKKGTRYYLHFNLATESARNRKLHRESGLDTHN